MLRKLNLLRENRPDQEIDVGKAILIGWPCPGMRTHVRCRSDGSRRAFDRERQAAADLIVLKRLGLNGPAQRNPETYSHHRLIGMAGEPAACISAVLPFRAVGGTVAGTSVDRLERSRLEA